MGLAFALSAAAQGQTTKLQLYSVNYPLQYFAERIGGEYVEVHFPAPPHLDPAFWIPDGPTIARYQKADLILLNGADYAKWVTRATLPRSRLVYTSAAFENAYIAVADSVAHSHGPTGAHSHAGTASTTWLDLEQAARQAAAIKDALVRKQPKHAGEFTRNYAALEKDLMTLDAELKALVAKDRARPLVASHPVYSYLARRYGMNIRAVRWEPDEFPTEAQWSELAQLRTGHPAQWMMWESQPLPEVRQRLEGMDLRSLVYAPCGNVPERGDFLSVMRRNADNLAAAYR